MDLHFVIAGVQKAGTTALHGMLASHPELALSTPKELHVFDDEDEERRTRTLAQIDRYFPEEVSDRRPGEATPIYTYWPNALERLSGTFPSVKLIVLLRHPVHRALSHWAMERARGREPLGFSESVRADGRARVARAPGGVHRVHSYVERGFYAAQIARAQRLVPRDNLLVLRTDALWLQPCETVGAVEAFLGVSHHLEPQARYIAPVAPRSEPSMAAEDRRYLQSLFYEDIIRTAELTGLDLADWLAPGYTEPMRRG